LGWFSGQDGLKLISSSANEAGGFAMQPEERLRSASPTTWVVRPDKDLEDLIPSFMQNRRNELVELQAAIRKNDFHFVRRLAHTWKGICRPYGFIHLETLSRSLEEAGEREDSSDVTRIADEIRDYIQNVRIVFDA
jgi:HPt (histidine-containing phosphotransfer) domain-containing protein